MSLFVVFTRCRNHKWIEQEQVLTPPVQLRARVINICKKKGESNTTQEKNKNNEQTQTKINPIGSPLMTHWRCVAVSVSACIFVFLLVFW